MITCQPRTAVVYLISGLLCSSYLLTGYWLYNIFTSPAPSLVYLFIVCLILSLLIFFTVKLAASYISIRAENDKLIIRYLLLGISKTYGLAALTSVDEVKINTFQKKEYRQLILNFGQEKITLNNQVYNGYDSLKNYVRRNKANNKSRRR